MGTTLGEACDDLCTLRLPQIYALGFVSVFDQIMESVAEDDRKKIFAAYVSALDESPEKYRSDAAQMESVASSLSGPDALTPDANGSVLQVRLCLHSMRGVLALSCAAHDHKRPAVQRAAKRCTTAVLWLCVAYWPNGAGMSSTMLAAAAAPVMNSNICMNCLRELCV